LWLDTGILTFIIRTKVPSLEIYDRSQDKYVKVEDLTNLGDIIVFMGEKVPMFTGRKTKFPATHHRVIVPSNTERLSMAFLLDVAK